jgi:arsenate reductase (thioredoxin)
MQQKKVLFICIHNSARSQMAEAWLNHFGQGQFQADSAGLEPGVLNPRVVKVMQEVGIDISQKTTQAVSDVIHSGRRFDYVVTVCDETSAERCPVFPGITSRLHWGFPDPAALTGEEEEIFAQLRGIRDSIKAKVQQWCQELGQLSSS